MPESNPVPVRTRVRRERLVLIVDHLRALNPDDLEKVAQALKASAPKTAKLLLDELNKPVTGGGKP